MQTRPLFSFLRVSFLTVTLWLVGTPAAIAQTQTLPRFEEQIVVTPARAETTLDRVPAFITLIDADDIVESSAQDIADLLRQAGIHVTDVTGNRRSYRVDLRGFGATASLNTLVLVDGRRANQPDLGGTDWSQIPLERVSRIEVIRGSGGAVTFGDSAAGGVINIITKGAETSETVVGMRGGAYSSLATEASSSGKRGDLGYSVSGRYNRSDGHRENAQTEGGDVGGRLSIRASERFELGLSGGLHSDKTGLPGSLKESDLAAGIDRASSVTPEDFADIDDRYVMVTPRVNLGGRGHALIDVSVRQRDSAFFSRFSAGPGGDSGEFTGNTGTRTLAVSPRTVLQGGLGPAVNQLVAGVDLSSAEEKITNTIVFNGFPDTGLFTLKKVSRGVYVQDALTAGPATFTAGYRFDQADYTFTGSGRTSETDFEDQVASLGATLKVTKDATIFGRLSGSFRYPVLDELFDFFANEIVTGLVPQRSVDFEGGLRLESGNAQTSISAFRIATDEEIFFNPVGGAFGFGANENLDGKNHRSGLELAASARAGAVQLGGTVTLTRTDIEGGNYDNQKVPGVPSTRATMQARFPILNRVSLGLEGLFVGRRRFEGDFGGQFGDQDAYFLLNGKLTYRRGRARLFLDLKNLLDEEYSEYGVLGGFPTERAIYPSPGIHAVGGVEIRF
jgi:iron complex outermembrane receptor protein